MGQAINGIAGGFPVYSGLQGPGGTMPGLVGQIDDQGNLIPGTGGLGNPNGPQVGIGSGGLPPGDASATSDPYAAQWAQSQSPGLGGKGGGGPLSQIPIDMQGNLLGGITNSPDPREMDGTSNLPQPPAAKPLGAEQGGTPGRPVPAAPMSPRGVGFSNPGAPGAPLARIGQPYVGNPAFPDLGSQQPKPPISLPTRPQAPQTIARPVITTPPGRSQFTPKPVQARRGAGRGGLLR